MALILDLEVVPLHEVPQSNQADATDKRPVILIVDDERVIADTLALILARSGFETYTAYDGESALRQAAMTPPQLMISDVMMPGMTGVELAIAMEAAFPECKVLLFSGQAATADLLVEARESGHNFEAISKPVHPTDMLRRITKSLDLPYPTPWHPQMRSSSTVAETLNA